MPTQTTPAPEFIAKYTDLTQKRLGAEVIFATDDFFADKSRMIDPKEAVFIADKYDENGKWMDGWESRRKREEGYDYCIVKLSMQGVIKGFDIDTSNFTGNYAPAASIDACVSPDGDPSDSTNWVEILPSMNLTGDTHHYVKIDNTNAWTHLRLNIYPDGGVARLRVYGVPQIDWDNRDKSKLVDLIAVENGGRAVTCNNAHFGKPDNLIAPGRGINMGDGWETARRRVPGNDWAILALGHPGIIEKIIIDTAHFKGNYPDKCSIQASYVVGGTDDALVARSIYWQELLPSQKMSMDHIHEYLDEVQNIGAITHIRLNIFPDGGVSRLRLYGTPEES